MAMATVYASDSVMVSDDIVPSLIPRLSVLGRGISRRTYDLGDGTVLKINTGDAWAGDCGTEAQTWENLKDTPDAKYLAPVLACAEDGSWLVMVKVDYVGCDDSESEWSEWDLQNALSQRGIGDLHSHNLGTLPNGNLVAIDYAYGSRGNGNVIVSDVVDDEPCVCTDCQFEEHRRHCREIPAHCDECRYHLDELEGTGRSLFCTSHPCSACHDECSCETCFLAFAECDVCERNVAMVTFDHPALAERVALCDHHAPNVWKRFTNPNKLFRVLNAQHAPWYLIGPAFSNQVRL